MCHRYESIAVIVMCVFFFFLFKWKHIGIVWGRYKFSRTKQRGKEHVHALSLSHISFLRSHIGSNQEFCITPCGFGSDFEAGWSQSAVMEQPLFCVIFGVRLSWFGITVLSWTSVRTFVARGDSRTCRVKILLPQKCVQPGEKGSTACWCANRTSLRHSTRSWC